MKLPNNISQVTLAKPENPFHSYPPTTFLPFWEHELGNGDMFGFYWPIGCESELPLVLEMWHDSWEMIPHFSSFERFLQLTNNLAEDDGVSSPTLEEDADSPRALVTAATESLKRNDVTTSITFLERATAMLPEYAEAQNLLALQYRRLQKNDVAIAKALQAFRCPPSFGRFNSQLWNWFTRQNAVDELTACDPLWKNRTKLKFHFGGEKQNDDYVILREIIEAYIVDNRPVEAFTLSQTYAEYMSSETISFRERYDFDLTSWMARQLEQWKSFTGTSRNLQDIHI